MSANRVPAQPVDASQALLDLLDVDQSAAPSDRSRSYLRSLTFEGPQKSRSATAGLKNRLFMNSLTRSRGIQVLHGFQRSTNGCLQIFELDESIRLASQFVGDHRWFAPHTGNDGDVDAPVLHGFE